MNNKSITDFIKPTIITAQQYGTKVSVEIDHSDTDLDELMDAFQTLIVGLGYHQTSFKNWVLDRADEYRETDNEELKEKLTEWQDDDVADTAFHIDTDKLVKKAYLAKMMEDDEQLGLYDSAFAEHNAHEEGFDTNELRHRYLKDSEGYESLNELDDEFFVKQELDDNSNNGGFDGKSYKQDTGTTYFSVPVNFYTDDEGNKVYDYEGMADQFEEQLAELDKSAVVMVSVETQPLSKELIKAAKKYKKKLKTQ
jgi:predicted SAM-dependent methyltransferase